MDSSPKSSRKRSDTAATATDSPSSNQLNSKLQLSGTGFCGKDNPVASESGLSNPQSSSGLTSCPENAHCNDNSLPEEASSVSAPSDDSLRNTVNMDCGALTSSGKISQSVGSRLDSPISGLKLNNQVDKGKDVIATGASPLINDKDHKGKDEMTTSASPLVNVKDVKGKDDMTTGTTPLVNNKDDKVKDGIATGASPLMSEQAQEMHQFKPLSDLKPAKVDEKLGAGNAPSEACLGVEPNSTIGCAFNNQCGGYSAAETGETGKEAEVGSPSQLGSRLNVEEQDHCSGHTDVQCTEPGQKTVQQDHILEKQLQLVGLQQRGVRRCCLQFEDVQGETIGKSISAHNLSGIAGFPSSSSSPEVLEVLESSSLDKPDIPDTGLLANVNKPTFSSQDSGNYTMKVPKPSGIGLHLNSIVNAMQIGSGATVSLKSAERGSLSILGTRSSSTMSYHLSKNSLNLPEVDSVISEDCKHDNAASIARSSNPSLSDMVKRMNDCSLFKPIELQPHLCDKRKSISENADNIDDSSPCSPKKKRKKTLDADDNNGCKRCNCKKTKCLKLYCDCFAAGIYCADSCACQGCLNRPEYEDTVLETRQQIESRNPLAFAPKIIQNITEPSARSSGDDGICYTPASARHKRGCNCKKSKCLKKYCECYQSGVGCCDGCRCEGCANMYGQKGDYSMIKNLVSKHDNDKIPDGPYDKKLESLVTRDSLALNELCNPHNLTPLTPSIQCSNHGKTAPKSLFSSERYIPSPESGLSFLAPYGTTPGSALNPDNHHVITESNNDIMDLVSFDQSLEYGSGDMVNHFSPGFDSPTQPNPQLRIQMLPGNPQVSPASSLCWRTSPINPETHFGGTKFLEVANFDGRLHGMLNDDTPEILKETSIPLHAVKVSSPNKKRVSPPHGHGTAIGSSSSAAGLRSGRKFILQAVSAFPPLTPCMDSKVHSGQDIKDSKDYGRR